MGAPSSQKEMKSFLRAMFNDPAIIPLSETSRAFVSFIISRSRYKSSWAKYEKIGGSPLKESMDQINEALSKELGNEYLVYTAYSYVNPTIEKGIDFLIRNGITDIKVIPVYPQSSYTTTGSVKSDIKKIKNKISQYVKIEIVEEFFKNKYFILFWKSLIEESISKNKLSKPLLLFSAHAIPEYLVKKGDIYVEAVKESARLIAEATGLDYKLSFQSRIGRMKWIGPDTREVLKELSENGKQEIVIIPISFINENLETRFDLDIEMIPYGKNVLKIKNLYRTELHLVHPLLIEALKEISQS